jgi:predicted permease
MSLSRFFRRGRWDDERAEELAAHLRIETDLNIARGMSPEEAERAARRKLGNLTLIREQIYEMNTIPFLDTLARDLGYGARLLGRNPTFAAVAISTLALGTGANTATFQLINALRLRTLPVAEPPRLVEVRIDDHEKGRTGDFMSRRPQLTNPLFERLRDEQQAFSAMLAWGSVRLDLARGGESRPADVMWVSGGFFEALGVAAARGRVFTAADDRRGCGAPGAVLSHAFFERHLGGDPSALGRPLVLDGQPYEIIGVTPPSFFGVEVGNAFDVALPLCAEPLTRRERTALDRKDAWFLAVIGRLKPEWTLAQANAHLRALSPALFETTPPEYTPRDAADYRAFTLEAVPAGTGVSFLRRTYATPLWALLGVTGLVLLIACANLANLMLARATAREREMGVRLAIGASRSRIARQLLSESLLIALAGASLGFLLAQGLSRSLVAFLSPDDDRLFIDLSLDGNVFAFTVALATATCLLFGLAPALRATGAHPGSLLKTVGRGTTDGRERFGLRRALVVAQVGLSMVLVVGAVLLGRSLRNLVTLDPGFRAEGVLVVYLDLRRTGAKPEARPALNDQILERLRAIPGVDAAAQVEIVPVSGSGWNHHVVVGGTVQPGTPNFNRVSADYFSVLRTPILRGRGFERGDSPGSPPVALVNESFARKFLPGNPVGQSFQIEEGPGVPRPFYEVVGLVKDTKYTDLREPFTPIAFLAASQAANPAPFLQVVLRSTNPIGSVTVAATRTVVEVNPSISILYRTLKAQVGDSLRRERLMAHLSGFFGGLAALIAMVGLYGVMSYTVARRKLEIGIRMALGADRPSVVRMIVGEAFGLLGAGLAVGTGLAVLAARTARSLLYGLEPWDPMTLALAMLALALISGLASWFPAHRAAGIEPKVALREE